MQMHDISDLYALVRDALVRSVSEAELETLDTSTSTEGEHTPTPSPGIPMSSEEFETTLQEFIDLQKWSSAITHVRQYKRISQMTGSNLNLTIFTYTNLDTRLKYDELTIILNAYAQSIMKDRQGKLQQKSLINKSKDKFNILTFKLQKHLLSPNRTRNSLRSMRFYRKIYIMFQAL